MAAGTNTHRNQDETDIFWVQDLCIPFCLLEYIPERRLQHEVWTAPVREDLASPWYADKVIVVNNTAMGL